MVLSSGIYINLINNKLSKKTDKLTLENNPNYVDWKKEYPIDNIMTNVSNNIDNKTETKRNNSFKKLKDLFSNIDSCSKGYFPFRIKIVELGFLINKFIGTNMFLNLDNLIRFDNGYYSYLIDTYDKFEKEAQNTILLGNYLNKQNIKFGYVLWPSKLSIYNGKLPKGIVDYTNKNIDTFLNILKENKISTLDLRKKMNEFCEDPLEAFFKADHHWKPETGFWATEETIKFLNREFKLNLDENVIKKENFNYKTYSKIFLGSQGKKVSLSLAEPEDFTIITPKFDTNINLEVYCRGVKKEGTFKDSLLNIDYLKDDFYTGSKIATYLGKITPIARITNKKITDKYKILIIKDSYIHFVAPFLSCLTNEILMIDLRKHQFNNAFDGSIYKLIEKEKPNIVLIMYNCGCFNPKMNERDNFHNFR